MHARALVRFPAVAFVIASLLAVQSEGASAKSHKTHKHIPGYALKFKRWNHSIGDMYGVGTYMAERYPTQYVPAVNRVKETGANWVREEFTASNLHHEANAPYHFARWDRVIDDEVHHGFHVLGLLDYNNTFKFGHDHAIMAHRHIKQYIADFVKYVTSVVTHYKHRIYAWQVWNEPDLGEFWKPYPYASDYAHLMTASYKAIKKANPWAQVVLGGPSGRDPSRLRFLHRVVAAGAKFDVLSIQPYTNFPGQNLVTNISKLKTFKKPIWFTEMGWAGQPGCQPCGWANSQASRLATTYLVSAVSGIRKVFWYDFRDDGIEPQFPDHFGLLEWNFGGKMAYVAYEVGVHYLNNATVVGVDHLHAGLTIYKLRRHSHHYFVAWNNSSRPVSVKMRWFNPPVNAFNYEGKSVARSRSHVLQLRLDGMSINYISSWGFRSSRWWPPALRIPPGHSL